MITQYQVGDIIRTRWNSVGKIVRRIAEPGQLSFWICTDEVQSGIRFIYWHDIDRLLSKEEAVIWLLEN